MKIIAALLIVLIYCNPNTCRTDDDCIECACDLEKGICLGETKH